VKCYRLDRAQLVRRLPAFLAVLGLIVAALAMTPSPARADTVYHLPYDGTLPATVADDNEAYTLGARFTTSAAGTVSAVRVWVPEGATQTCPHQPILFGGTTELARGSAVTPSLPAAAGTWVDLPLSESVPIEPGTTYTAGYTTTTCGYPVTGAYFSSGPRTSEGNPLTVTGGAFHVGAIDYPDQTFNDANYWADVVFTPDVEVSPSPSPSSTPTPSASASPSPSPTVVVTPTDPPDSSTSVTIQGLSSDMEIVMQVLFSGICLCVMLLGVLVIRSFRGAA
jgi:hypothetical protein